MAVNVWDMATCPHPRTTVDRYGFERCDGCGKVLGRQRSAGKRPRRHQLRWKRK
jgi:hypothetical protein